MNFKPNSMRSKHYILSFLILLLSSFSFAQPGPRAAEKQEDIESMKVAFITKKLNLTPEEAQLFWPVYNQYSDKLKELRKKRRQDLKTTKENFDEMTDKEVEAAVDAEIIFRQKELEIQKEYHTKFKAVLPIKKVAKLYASEEEFKKVLLDKLKKP
jgi:Spy/CpxP family protein refolding chaperone